MALLLPLLLPRIALILCALVTMAAISYVAGYGWCVLSPAAGSTAQGADSCWSPLRTRMHCRSACGICQGPLCHRDSSLRPCCDVEVLPLALSDRRHTRVGFKQSVSIEHVLSCELQPLPLLHYRMVPSAEIDPVQPVATPAAT